MYLFCLIFVIWKDTFDNYKKNFPVQETSRMEAKGQTEKFMTPKNKLYTMWPQVVLNSDLSADKHAHNAYSQSIAGEQAHINLFYNCWTLAINCLANDEHAHKQEFLVLKED